MNQFLAPILTLTSLGLFFGLVLSWASRKFAVVQDARIEQVLAKLPGVNCGACGMAGCLRFAESLAKKEVVIENCKACTQEVASEIANILGEKFSAVEKKIATLHCYGGRNAQDKFIYQGVQDCQAAAQTQGGHKLCDFACFGFGNCAKACPFEAIQLSPEGLPMINSQFCTACGKCVQACPRNLLVLMPKTARVYVGCSSRQPAKMVVSACRVGCIACKKCEKSCPVAAIKVIENLAVIDYDICTFCGKCVEACPRKIIFRSE